MKWKWGYHTDYPTSIAWLSPCEAPAVPIPSYLHRQPWAENETDRQTINQCGAAREIAPLLMLGCLLATRLACLAKNKQTKNSAGELTWKRVIISMNNHTTHKLWGGGNIWYYIPGNLWGTCPPCSPPPPPPIDAHSTYNGNGVVS